MVLIQNLSLLGPYDEEADYIERVRTIGRACFALFELPADFQSLSAAVSSFDRPTVLRPQRLSKVSAVHAPAPGGRDDEKRWAVCNIGPLYKQNNL